MDLGYKSQYDSPEVAPAQSEKKESRTYYPSVTIEGKAAEKLAKCCSSDDEITFNCRARVVGVTDQAERNQQYNSGKARKSVELELIDMQPQGLDMSEEDDMDSADEAFDEYQKGRGEE